MQKLVMKVHNEDVISLLGVHLGHPMDVKVICLLD